MTSCEKGYHHPANNFLQDITYLQMDYNPAEFCMDDFFLQISVWWYPSKPNSHFKARTNQCQTLIKITST